MAKAILEPLTAEMRIHNEDDAIYGDPYKYGVVIRYLSPTSVQVDLLCADGSFGTRHVRAIKAELKAHGVTKWTFNRIKNQKVKEVKGETK